jgi:HD superfamily phosphodiesterase
MAHTDHFIAEYGIAIAHPDAVVRIANIPLDLTKDKRVELLETILRYQKRLTKGIVNTVLFANNDLIYQIERAGREAQYVVHPEPDPWGRPVMSINGLRIRQQDAILSTEGRAEA